MDNTTLNEKNQLTGLDAIMSRRSIRDFTNERIGEETRRTLLMAGMAAPSAHGKKPWRFAIIDNKETLERIVALLPWFKSALSADFTILVCGNPSVCVQKEYWTVDCAAATENILVAARSINLGSVWMGIAPIEDNIRKVTEIIELPQGIIPFSMIALGRPANPEAQAVIRDSWRDDLLVTVKAKR